MSDEQEKTSRTWWLILCAAMLPVLYVLSVGPAAYVIERTRSGQEAGRLFYAPLIWLHDNTPLRGPLEWYVRSWEKAARKR
jgi:hypothetical protein